MMKILYINSRGVFGGGNRSLYELISAFPENEIDAKIITPQGDAAEYFSELGELISCKGLSSFDNTKYSHYRYLRWFILLREFYYVIPNIVVLWKAKKRWPDIDVIHVNEITLLFSVFLCKRFFRNVPIIMHVRSVQKNPSAFSSKMITKFLKRSVDFLISIDESVSLSLSEKLDHVIIHNGLSLCSSSDHVLPIYDEPEFTIGFVGNFLKSKGIIELLTAFEMGIKSGMKIRLLLVGHRNLKSSLQKSILNILGLNQNYDHVVSEYIQVHGLTSKIELVPFTINIEDIYRRMDVLCFPSCFNACGRPVFEAALVGKPSIVTISDKKIDTITNGVTGICIEDNKPETIYNAISGLYRDRSLCKELGVNARKMAEDHFDIVKNAQRVLAIYHDLVANH